MSQDVFEVRVNRVLLLVLAGVGGLFFLAGLDGLVFHSVFDMRLSLWSKLVFAFFFLGVGGAIAVNCLLYILRPPVMLRLSPEGVSFGLGFRYRHATPIPWRYVSGARLGAELRSLTSLKQLMCGPQILFVEDGQIPSSLVTSAGVSYAFRTLSLSFLFMDRLPATVVARAEEYRKRFA